METASSLAFGSLLKRARRAARLTQAQLAERAGFSVVYVSMLERGARQPQRMTVALLAEALALAPAERAALETAAHLPSTTLPLDRRTARDTGTSHLPIGGFLGATPTGPLVGRERELATIASTLDAVARGQGRLFFLVGEPGVGKTRLAQEITLTARAQGFHVVTGRCYEPQQTVAYYPFLEALAMAVALMQDDAASEADLTQRWPEVAHLLPDRASSVEPAAASLGEDRNAQQRLFWQVTSFLQTLANGAPLALLLDDLHWADRASLDLLQHLARHTRDRRLLLVGTYRDVEVGRQHPLEGALRDLLREALFERVMLRRMGATDVAALIATTLDAGGVAGEVTEELQRLIYERTDGNPFFAKQVARSLQERQLVVLQEGQWIVNTANVSELDVPESIRAVIGQRLTQLTPVTQEVLREASVLGQVFGFADLRAMSGRGEQEVEEALEEAVGAGIVREGQQDRYGFNHALTRDTLSAELSARRKRRLHRAAGEAIEQQPDHERRAAEIGYHFLAADEGERALPYALLAGDQAAAVYAHAEAAAHYRTAVELAREVGDQANEARALEHVAQMLVRQERGEEALDVAEQSLRLNAMLRDHEAQARLAQVIADVHTSRGTSAEGVARLQTLMANLSTAELSAHGQARLYQALGDALIWSAQFATGPATLTHALAALAAEERALAAAQQTGDAALRLEILHPYGLAHYILGHQDECLRAWEEMIPLAEAARRVDQLFAALLSVGYTYLYRGQFAPCRAYFARALALSAQHDWLSRSWVHGNYGELEYLCGDWAQAQAHFERGSASAGDTREMTHSTAAARIWRGLLLVLQGDEEQAASALEEPLLWAERYSHLEVLRGAHGVLAERDLLAGRFAEARARLEPLQDRDGAQRGDLRFIGPPLAWVYLEVGDIALASATIAELRACVHEGQAPPLLSDALRVEALIAARAGQWQEATDALDEALTVCRAMPYPYAEAKALYVYGRLEVARGNPAAARGCFTAALAICARLGERLYAEHIERALAATV